MNECDHPSGYVVSDTGKDMKCFQCGHVREIVPIHVHYHNKGFRLTRTKKPDYSYSDYALTRFGVPAVCAYRTISGTELRPVVPVSIKEAYAWMNTILMDEQV